jgi:hypothetical protein
MRGKAVKEADPKMDSPAIGSQTAATKKRWVV